VTTAQSCHSDGFEPPVTEVQQSFYLINKCTDIVRLHKKNLRAKLNKVFEVSLPDESDVQQEEGRNQSKLVGFCSNCDT
jgi:hypothetical protein